MIDISVVIPTKNDEKNLQTCLSLLKDFSEVIVVDSNSSDNTQFIVNEYGYSYINFEWNGKFPKKRNWVLRNIKLKNEWVLFLDSDEFVDNDFIKEISEATKNDHYNGYWIFYDNYFMGKRLKYGVKMHKLALFKVGKGEYEYIQENFWSKFDMEIHEHPIIKGNIGQIKSMIKHNDYKGLQYYIDKHNQYSSWEANRYMNLNKNNKNLTYRQKVKYKLMDTWILGHVYFIYSYFFRLGFLDGKMGFIFNIFKCIYFFQIKCKISENKKSLLYQKLD